jgi:hypothetical protein
MSLREDGSMSDELLNEIFRIANNAKSDKVKKQKQETG